MAEDEVARRLVAERIRAWAGLDPPGWLLDARLAERARALGLDEAAYLELAARDGDERARLADSLRVGETRFFRHRAQLVALSRALPECAREAAAAARPLRAWSAGCASGEEAWTLAMLLDEARPPSGWEVLGTDLSEAALDFARAGRYPAERARDLPAPLAARWLDGDGAERRVADGLRPRVNFSRHNLLDARYPTGFDVILCRNVLIYFDAEKRTEVIGRLSASLRDGGYLFLGYSETLRDHDRWLEALRDGDGVIYRKRARLPKSPASRSEKIVVGVAVPERLPVRTPALGVPVENREDRAAAGGETTVYALRGEYPDAERLSAELRPLIAAGRAVVDLDGAEFLGDAAARVLQRAGEAAPGLELRATRPAVRRWLERHGIKAS